MAAVGRPSLYKPEHAKKCAELCFNGATDSELADFFGVSITTIKNWAYAHPEFLAAMRVGKDIADDRVERSLYQRSVGYTFDSVKVFMPAGATEAVIVPIREHVPPSETAAFRWLSNRRSAEWRDKQQIEHSGVVRSETVDLSGLNADQLRALASIKVPAE